jgi:hypothetical protein
MAQAPELPEELRNLIGVRAEPQVLEVEKGAIRRYCDAVGDSSPLFRDPDYAKNTRYGGVIAPPGFYGWPLGGKDMMVFIGEIMGKIMKATGLSRLLDGGVTNESYVPIYAGDTVVADPKFTDITMRQSKSGGNMVFTTMETTYFNQNGTMVAKRINTFVLR